MTNQAQNSPKFAVRYTLGLFALANWAYNTIVTGSETSLADFSILSTEVFNDQMFFVGAYQQLLCLVADINDTRVVDEMLDAKTFLLNKKALLQTKNLSEEGMKNMIKEGHSVYSLLFSKRLAENIIFEDEFSVSEYTCIDGSDNKATDITVPLHMVFSIDDETLSSISRLLDYSDTTIVPETIDKFLADPKLSCFHNSFAFMTQVESID